MVISQLHLNAAEVHDKRKKGANALAAHWRLCAASAPSPEGRPVTITARLTAPVKKELTCDISVVVTQSLQPHSIEIIEPGRFEVRFSWATHLSAFIHSCFTSS